MLKCAFISGLEECVFFVWRDLPTKCYLAFCTIFICQWMERKCGGLMMTGDMYSYFSKLFSVDQHWNLEHIVLTIAFFCFKKVAYFQKGCIYGLKRNGGLGRLFIFVHSVCPFSCIVFLLCEKKLFCSSKKLYCVSLTLYCIVLLKLLYNLVCKFANIKYKSYSYKCMKFFFKSCVYCVCVLVYKYMQYMWGQYDRE